LARIVGRLLFSEGGCRNASARVSMWNVHEPD
jgi:hypothetical protein